MDKLDRKKFLKTGGLSLAAMAFAGGAGAIFTGCEEEPKAEPEKEVDAVEHPIIVPDTVDPDEAAERAWDSYKDGNG